MEKHEHDAPDSALAAIRTLYTDLVLNPHKNFGWGEEPPLVESFGHLTHGTALLLPTPMCRPCWSPMLRLLTAPRSRR